MKEYNKLLEDTNQWLSSIESNNTRINYKKHIDNYCQFMFSLPLEKINKEILNKKKVNFETMLLYKNELSEIKNYSGQTIRAKIYSVLSWLGYLRKIGEYNIDSLETLRLDKKTMPKIKSNNGSKPFTHEEVIKMIEKSKEYQNGEMKSLLIEWAYTTAWRKGALLSNLTFGSIYKIHDNSNYWLVDIVDKGEKEDTKSISNDLYERTMKLNIKNNDNDLIFNLSSTSADNLILQLKKDLNIQGDKTFHSIKKASINRVIDLTGNILLAQKHGVHESIETTVKFYAKYNQDFGNMMSLHIMDNLNLSKIEDLSKEELIKLIYSCDDRTRFAINMQLNK